MLARLRELKLKVEESDALSRHDFIVNGGLRVALRTAFPCSYQRYVRRGKRRYSYVYRAWTFNFHHRGRIDEQYCDFFICVPLGLTRTLDLSSAYVIPWEARSGMTFSLPESQRGYCGKYAIFRNAWHKLRKSARAA